MLISIAVWPYSSAFAISSATRSNFVCKASSDGVDIHLQDFIDKHKDHSTFRARVNAITNKPAVDFLNGILCGDSIGKLLVAHTDAATEMDSDLDPDSSLERRSTTPSKEKSEDTTTPDDTLLLSEAINTIEEKASQKAFKGMKMFVLQGKEGVVFVKAPNKEINDEAVKCVDGDGKLHLTLNASYRVSTIPCVYGRCPKSAIDEALKHIGAINFVLPTVEKVEEALGARMNSQLKSGSRVPYVAELARKNPFDFAPTIDSDNQSASIRHRW